MPVAIAREKLETWSDEEVVARVLDGYVALFEILMRRHNQRIYRAARAILHDEHEAEDVMQETYVRAFAHLGQFAGRAQFSTWLTRIAVHEALARKHRQSRYVGIDSSRDEGLPMEQTLASPNTTPEQQAAASEALGMLEGAIGALPEHYRLVLMMRDVEEMSTAEVADVLEISEDNVKIRLFRARALVRKELYARAGATSSAAFQFHASRCDRIVHNVMARIAEMDVEARR